MRALHQVITRAADVRNGNPVFAGTLVPVRALLEHLEAGRDLESFLVAYPEVTRETVTQALALGLEALLREVPMEAPRTQASLLPRLDAAGVILNAEELRIDQVVGKRVRCPACRMLVFRSWPEGWDAHAGMRCRGLAHGDPIARKAEFKRRFGHLFRLVLWAVLTLASGRTVVAQVDSLPIRKSAEAAQASFERARRHVLPRFAGGVPSPCEVRIGRFCYWYDQQDELPADPPAAVRARDHLLKALGRAQAELPGDGWIVGQRIRYLVEHGEAEAAVESARGCGAEPSWCAALSGYALHAAGRFVEAEAAFELALREMAPKEAERWQRLDPLIDGPSKVSPALADTLLWLGDPLYSRPGNDLRTELLSRRVMERLLATARRPRVMSWGSDAAELLYRYGWSIRWSVDVPPLAGPESESIVGHGRQPAYGFFPVLSRDWSWDLSRPGPRSRYSPAYAEAFAPIPRHQLSLFRRGDSVVAVASFDLSRDTLFRGASVRAALALARDPLTAPVVGQEELHAPRGVVVAVAPWFPRVVSLEVERPEARRFARVRTASEADTAGAFGISDLLLFEAGPTLPGTLAEAAETAMSGSEISRSRPVGLYWEVYGIAGDTVAVAVSVVPARKGLLGRMGQTLGVIGRPPPMTLEWTGVGQGTDFAGRAIELDLGRLEPGRYTIAIEARDRSGRRASARRPVVVH